MSLSFSIFPIGELLSPFFRQRQSSSVQILYFSTFFPPVFPFPSPPTFSSLAGCFRADSDLSAVIVEPTRLSFKLQVYLLPIKNSPDVPFFHLLRVPVAGLRSLLAIIWRPLALIENLSLSPPFLRLFYFFSHQFMAIYSSFPGKKHLLSFSLSTGLLPFASSILPPVLCTSCAPL